MSVTVRHPRPAVPWRLAENVLEVPHTRTCVVTSIRSGLRWTAGERDLGSRLASHCTLFPVFTAPSDHVTGCAGFSCRAASLTDQPGANRLLLPAPPYVKLLWRSWFRNGLRVNREAGDKWTTLPTPTPHFPRSFTSANYLCAPCFSSRLTCPPPPARAVPLNFQRTLSRLCQIGLGPDFLCFMSLFQ